MAVMVGHGIAGREKSAGGVGAGVCKRRGQVRERDDKKGSKPGRMVRVPVGYTTVPGMKGGWGSGGRGGGKKRRGRTPSERVVGRLSAASEPVTRSTGKKREVLGINGRNPAGHYTLLDTT